MLRPLVEVRTNVPCDVIVNTMHPWSIVVDNLGVTLAKLNNSLSSLLCHSHAITAKDHRIISQKL